MKYTKQRHKMGCAVACLAMVTGHGYKRVRQWFISKHNFDPIKSLLPRKWVMHYLAEHGYWIKWRVTNNSKPLWGFAHAYILYVQTKKTSRMHYISVDEDGMIYDPSNRFRTHLDGYHVVEIIGCMNNYHISKNVRIG